MIILDEAQALPAELLTPTLDVLQQLIDNYNVTVLMTTATQPSLHSRQLGAKFFKGLDPKPTEIIPEGEVESMFGDLKRVEVQWPSDEVVEWTTLAAQAGANEQVLVITHLRDDAANLWSLMKDVHPDTVHLSAAMCPTHRLAVLKDIRETLDAGEPCRVISTQIVEAGIDIDFPVVYRAMAGFEALAQAAGRCNREGKLEAGQFIIYNPPSNPPHLLALHRKIASVMRASNPNIDMQSPETFRKYFDRLYSGSTDTRGIQPLRESLSFRSVSDAYHIIDDAARAVVVPYGLKGQQVLESYHANYDTKKGRRWRKRALQPFSITVYSNKLTKLIDDGSVVAHNEEDIFELTNMEKYDVDRGLLS